MESVCLLAALDPLVGQVHRQLAKVHAEGGTGQTFTMRSPARAEDEWVIGQFNAARDLEYAQILERTPAMLGEIEAETARGRATYAEVEKSEADLHRFETWLLKITARDYFDAPGRPDAEAAVERWAHALGAFEAAALAADTGPGHESLDATVRPPARLTLMEGN